MPRRFEAGVAKGGLLPEAGGRDQRRRDRDDQIAVTALDANTLFPLHQTRARQPDAARERTASAPPTAAVRLTNNRSRASPQRRVEPSPGLDQHGNARHWRARADLQFGLGHDVSVELFAERMRPDQAETARLATRAAACAAPVTRRFRRGQITAAPVLAERRSNLPATAPEQPRAVQEAAGASPPPARSWRPSPPDCSCQANAGWGAAHRPAPRPARGGSPPRHPRVHARPGE